MKLVRHGPQGSELEGGAKLVGHQCPAPGARWCVDRRHVRRRRHGARLSEQRSAAWKGGRCFFTALAERGARSRALSVSGREMHAGQIDAILQFFGFDT